MQPHSYPDRQLPSSLPKLTYNDDRQAHRYNRVRDGRGLRSRCAHGCHEPLAFPLAVRTAMLREVILDPETFRLVNIVSSLIGMVTALWSVAKLARQ